MKYLEKVEVEGKIIRGRIIEGEIWIVANDITDLFGYKSGRNAVNEKVSKNNIMKYPVVLGVNGNQCNVINIAGIKEIMDSKIKKIDEEEKKKIKTMVGCVINYFVNKKKYLQMEENFVWKERERRREEERAKKPFWKRIFNF